MVDKILERWRKKEKEEYRRMRRIREAQEGPERESKQRYIVEKRETMKY